jgi:hypothetical protein
MSSLTALCSIKIDIADSDLFKNRQTRGLDSDDPVNLRMERVWQLLRNNLPSFESLLRSLLIVKLLNTNPTHTFELISVRIKSSRKYTYLEKQNSPISPKSSGLIPGKFGFNNLISVKLPRDDKASWRNFISILRNQPRMKNQLQI